MREVLMAVICGIWFYCLTMQITQCFTDGTGGISEDEAEDEKIK